MSSKSWMLTVKLDSLFFLNNIRATYESDLELVNKSQLKLYLFVLKYIPLWLVLYVCVQCFLLESLRIWSNLSF